MKSINELEHYYKSEIYPNLGAFRALMNVSKYITIMTLIGFANFFIGIGGKNGLIVSGVLVGVGFLLMYLNNSKINSFFRNKITLPMMKQITEDEQFSFSLDGSIAKREIRASKLLYFSKNNTLSQSKLLTYQDKERTIKMLNVCVKNTTHDIDGEAETTTVEGLFIAVPTKMKITGTTLVVSDVAERIAGYVGGLLQSKKKNGLRKITLDSPTFEKLFIVYGNDEVMAHYLLKHTVMEVLSELGQKFKFQFEISFVEGKLYLFFYFAGGWFEPEVEINKKKEEILTFEVIRNDIEVIYSAIEAVHRIEKHHHLSF